MRGERGVDLFRRCLDCYLVPDLGHLILFPHICEVVANAESVEHLQPRHIRRFDYCQSAILISAGFCEISQPKKAEPAMSGRAATPLRNWETRLHANALASQILATLNERKSEVQRCALDGLARENPQFERATTKQFREEAVGHCDTILQTMLAIATGRAATLGPDPFAFVQAHAVRRARQQFPLAGSLNAYRLAHKAYWEVMRNSAADAMVPESEKTDCLMILSEFLLEFFDRISGIMTDAYIAEEKRMIARSTRAHVALIEDLLHGRQPGDLEAQGLSERCGMHSGSPIAVVIGRISHSGNGRFHGAGKLERLSGFFHRALSPLAFGRLIDIRKDEVLAILTAGAQTSKRVRQGVRRDRRRVEGRTERSGADRASALMRPKSRLSGSRTRGRVCESQPADPAFCRHRSHGISGAPPRCRGAARRRDGGSANG